MEPIARRRPEAVASDVSRAASPDARANAFGGRLPEEAGPLTLAESINATLTDALAARPEILVFGEDVGQKGGVYGVTRGLQRRFGITRVFDTLLDEQTILGVALGCGVSGLLPVPEIQYLAYLHNAEDQLRGEAATLPFFSNGQYTTRWCCGSPDTATKRASAAISTTTTPWQSSETYPGSSWRLQRDRTTRRPCSAPASQPRPLTDRRAFSRADRALPHP